MELSRSRLKLWLGSGLETLMPELSRDIATGANPSRFVWLKSCILYARTIRAQQKGDAGTLQKVLFDNWRIDRADSFYDKFTDRFDRWFLGPHHEIVDQLQALSRKTRFESLIEIGCGDGRVLEHCVAALPDIRRAVGIDINPAIIARNRETFRDNSLLSFTAADASTWLAEHMQDGTIVLTYGGVMEYFSAAALSSMFRSIAKYDRVAVALVEPVDPTHDLQTDPDSHTFGEENSFSHNHRVLLGGAGFEIAYSTTVQLGGVTWAMMIAVNSR